MEDFRSALNAARTLPDAQAEEALRDLLKQYPDLSPADEGNLRYTLGVALFIRARPMKRHTKPNRPAACWNTLPEPQEPWR